uniref:DNA polymerase epsilon subunit C n=1 Tax=Erigeron canadensis TaxID=72917 RepID=UPI001CB99C95|nr:DNA polymerase epsilon subunit C [Erigeron canadensis]
MATEKKQNPETKKRKSNKAPAPAKSNGKHKINSLEKQQGIPIITASSSHIQTNGTKSKSKSKSKSSEKQNDVVYANGTENGSVKENKKKSIEKVKESSNSNSNNDNISIMYQIPMNRVSRIVKSEDPNIRITQDAVFAINKASEKFLQLLTTEAYASAFLDRKKNIDYKHLSSVVSKRRRLDFLSDFVPEKVKAEDALKESSPAVET